MGKVEGMVDLKPKAEKITEEQLQELQSVVNDNNAIQFRIGGLEAQKHELLHQQVGVQSRISELQSTFSKEYGTFDVDLQDGSINYPANEESRN
jgi:hypothetical protein|tara:strand:- start:1323 stop:1604 length:282 start_codon:yes stop_codon:yes gene_type:complete